MNLKVLIMASPDSIHTRKWVEGWKLISYTPLLTGISDKPHLDNDLIIPGKINSQGGNASTYLKNIFRFKKILHRTNPAIINAHYLSSYGLIAAILKRKKDLLIHFLMGSDVMLSMDKSILHKVLSYYSLSKADIIVSVSEAMTTKLLHYFPSLKNKIITGQYGIDTDLLDTFSTQKKDIDLISNRNWIDNSNYPVIMEAFETFQESSSIALVGNNGSEYAHNLLQDHPTLQKSVYPMIPYHENMKLVGRSKIFVSLTSSDGTPLSLLEALYLGAVPIVSDLKTNREVIQDGINGYIIPVDSKILIKTLRTIQQLSEEELYEIREFNRNLILEKYNFKTFFLRLDNRVKTLLQENEDT